MLSTTPTLGALLLAFLSGVVQIITASELSTASTEAAGPESPDVASQKKAHVPSVARQVTQSKRKRTNFPKWSGRTPDDLSREYSRIFRTHNRNAASHLWASFILDRSQNFDEKTIESLFSGFCAVSGSPVRPSDYNRYGLNLLQVPQGVDHNESKVGSGSNKEECTAITTGFDDDVVQAKKYRFGFMHYCCWPCVCDTQDFIRVDSKTVELKDGKVDFMRVDSKTVQVKDGVTKTFYFAVIPNPCQHPEKLSEKFFQPFDGRKTSILESAGEVKCIKDPESGEMILKGATLSDHGYPIINMFFDSAEVKSPSLDVSGNIKRCENMPAGNPGRLTEEKGRKFQHECEWKDHCEKRAAQGYNSGMGEIFRKVAGVSDYPVQEKCMGVGALGGREEL